MSDGSLIFVVDDDDDVRDSIRALLEASQYAVKCYPSAKDFLADDGAVGHCLLADVRMPEMDGLDLQEEVSKRGLGLPVIIVTGHGDVPLAVRAMKAGAVDFIEKPFDEDTLLASIRRAIEIGNKTRSQAAEAAAAERLLALLTPRERMVLDQLVIGRSNKVAAHELGISPRTVEIHRAHIMDKLNARSLSDLVRIALAAIKGASGSA
jgi:two-component system, LuxR family, response regulator FixJ